MADDHNLVRSGLAALLSQDGRYEVVAEATDGIEAVEKTKQIDADLLVVDVSMPRMGGIEVIGSLAKCKRGLRFLVLSMYDDAQFVARAFNAGAHGYLLKQSLDNQLFAAIESVIAGETFMSEQIDRDAVGEFCLHDEELTPRELEVLHLITDGHTNAVVAKLLRISPNTVVRHRANLMQKLNVHNRI